jgi:endonuclease/exonuclease/phosphatase family metal-dependent hydrolase
LDAKEFMPFYSMKSGQSKVKRNIGTWLLIVMISMSALGFLYVAQRNRSLNYQDPEAPRFEGHYAQGAEHDGEITVASYNIFHGKKIEDAIQDLSGCEALKNADIVLLQEMDEIGTERIARKLGYNYIYFPAGIHPRSRRNFGNAILSRWPITKAHKVILPHHTVLIGIQRTATKAIVEIDGEPVSVYSVHGKTILTRWQKRQEQWVAILNDVAEGAKYVVVGGDFNTVGEEEIQQLDEQMAAFGLVRAQGQSAPTVSKFFMTATTDHIYTRGFTISAWGTLKAAKGSDHCPIWVNLDI